MSDIEMMLKMMNNESVQGFMPQVMKHILPGCVSGMLPHLDQQARAEFTSSVRSILEEA